MLKGLFGDAKTTAIEKGTELKERLDAKTTAVFGKINETLNGAKTTVVEKIKETLKDDKTILIEEVDKKIKELNDFFKENTTKLDTFSSKRTNLLNVIKALKGNMKTLQGVDALQSVECSYYDKYEDIDKGIVKTGFLTLIDVEKKRDIQIGFCKKLFEDNDNELKFITEHINSIGEILIKILIINDSIVRPKKIDTYIADSKVYIKGFLNETQDDTQPISAEDFKTRKVKLEGYRKKLFEYALPECIVKIFGGSYKKKKEYKKINALNRGDMRGGGVDGVDTQLKELEAFFDKHKELDALIKKRIELDGVLKALDTNIKHLRLNIKEDSAVCSYYDKYEDIGDANKLVTNTLKLPNIEKIFNKHIGFCDGLIKDIKASISNEEIDKKRKDIIGYRVSSDKLFEDISKKDKNPDSYAIVLTKSLFGAESNSQKSDILKEQNIKLLKYLKKLEYLVDTTCKYEIITILPDIPKPKPFLEEGQKGGGSYKKTNKKNILGKERCIYKITGDRKEYIKYKGNFIAVRDYKNLMKSR